MILWYRYCGKYNRKNCKIKSTLILQGGSGISGFTFVNFVLSAASVAANLGIFQ